MLDRDRGQSGQATLELVLVLPFLLLIILAIVQIAKVWNNHISLTNATRVGARVAAVSRCPTGSGCTCPGNTVQAVRNAASNLNQASLNVTYSPACSSWTLGGSVSVTATYPYNVNLFGLVVKTGTLTSTTTERVE